MIFGEDTVAVLMPIRRGPWRARLACDVAALSNESVHSTKSPAKMLVDDVLRRVTMPPKLKVKNSSTVGPTPSSAHAEEGS